MLKILFVVIFWIVIYGGFWLIQRLGGEDAVAVLALVVTFPFLFAAAFLVGKTK